MENTSTPVDSDTAPGATAVGSTALGRLQMRVPQEDGYEDVVVERRWPDPAAARAWCERTVQRAVRGTVVLEIEVFEETWRHPRSWETTRPHPVAASLQIGVAVADGTVRWSRAQHLLPDAGARYLR